MRMQLQDEEGPQGPPESLPLAHYLVITRNYDLIVSSTDFTVTENAVVWHRQDGSMVYMIAMHFLLDVRPLNDEQATRVLQQRGAYPDPNADMEQTILLPKIQG